MGIISMVYLQVENQGENVEFNLNLSKTHSISLEIFSITGRKIKKLVSTIPLVSGQYKYYWNGYDHFGLPICQNQFFAKLLFDDSSLIKYFEFNQSVSS
ncbi:MAG: hypothetical protein APR63_03835 [Desulfuromonas sp. SDB]|nr:MAG: hypothetical protein APR63_03835 [Desulfuromonas sp. SDB]